MRVIYNVVAAVAMAAVLVLGGGLTAMVIVGRAPGSEVIVLLLKLLAAAAYVSAITIGVYLWRRSHWAVVGVPILAVAAPVLIVLIGNALINWGFPIWPSHPY